MYNLTRFTLLNTYRSALLFALNLHTHRLHSPAIISLPVSQYVIFRCCVFRSCCLMPRFPVLRFPISHFFQYAYSLRGVNAVIPVWRHTRDVNCLHAVRARVWSCCVVQCSFHELCLRVGAFPCRSSRPPASFRSQFRGDVVVVGGVKSIASDFLASRASLILLRHAVCELGARSPPPPPPTQTKMNAEGTERDARVRSFNPFQFNRNYGSHARIRYREYFVGISLILSSCSISPTMLDIRALAYTTLDKLWVVFYLY